MYNAYCLPGHRWDTWKLSWKNMSQTEATKEVMVFVSLAAYNLLIAARFLKSRRPSWFWQKSSASALDETGKYLSISKESESMQDV